MKDSVFLFDGNCSFCTRLASFLEWRVKPQGISFQSFRSLNETDLKTLSSELTWENCEREVQLVQKGKRYPGIFAIRILFLRSYMFFPIGILLYFPLVPILGMLFLYLLQKIRNY